MGKNRDTILRILAIVIALTWVLMAILPNLSSAGVDRIFSWIFLLNIGGAFVAFSLANCLGESKTAAWAFCGFVMPYLVLPILAFRKHPEQIVEKMKANKDVRRLIKALKNPKLCGHAGVALIAIDDDLVIEPLIRALEDKSREVRRASVLALAGRNDRRINEALIRAQNDEDEEVRDVAQLALADATGKDRIVQPLASESEEFKSLIEKLSLKPREEELELFHPEKWKAIEKIEQLEGVAFKPLLEALDSADIEARGTIISLLGRLKDKRAVLPIAEQLANSNAKVKIDAMSVLKQYATKDIQDLEVVKYLNDAATDDNIDLRNGAKEILSRLGISVSENPWYLGANTFDQLAKAFIRLEIHKPSPDFRCFAKHLQKYSAEERHGAWVYVAGKLDTINKTNSMRCYLEALYNDPGPNSVAWNWLNGYCDKEMNILAPDSPKTFETVEKLRSEYRAIVDE